MEMTMLMIGTREDLSLRRKAYNCKMAAGTASKILRKMSEKSRRVQR